MNFARDLSGAFRSFRKNPGFTAAVVGMLAVGIGATTAMFSIADGVLFAPLPYAHEKQLVEFTNHGTRRGDRISPPDLFDIGRGVKSLVDVGGVYAGPGLLTGEGDALSVGKGTVTANWFSLLGIQPEIGRFFEPGEDDAGAAKVVVINDDLWRSRFDADRGVLGRVIMIDHVPRTVIGVAPRQFAFPYKLGAWIPLSKSPDMVGPARRGNRYLEAVARLAPGATLAGARAELKTFAARLHAEYPVPETGLDLDLMPLRAHVVGDARPALLVMVAAVGFILLIACANVASLLLLRARHRSSEMGIRLALGASPRRVMREMLAESVAYGMAAGALGIVLAEAAVRAIVALRPAYIPFVDDIAVDWRVLAFATVVTLVTAVAFGIAPAIFASKTDLLSALTSGTRSASAGKRSTALRQAFVVLELALALVLLVGAGLLGKSFARLMAVDTGFRPVGLVHFDIYPPSYPARPDANTAADSSAPMRAAVDAYIKELRAVPGTTIAAAGFGAPFTGPAVNQRSVHIEGDAPDPEDRPSLASWKSVTPGYLEALGVKLERGRYFTEQDREGATKVVIVNDAFVAAYLGGRDPIGRIVANGGEIVGVIGNTKNQSLTEPPDPELYAPFDQLPVGYLTVLVRSSASPASVIATARKVLATFDRDIPVGDVGTYDDLVRSTQSRSQQSWELVAGFSLFALLLSAAGIYSVVAFAVRERRREFGVRIALGAQQRQIVALVIRHAAVLSALGLAVGLAGSLAASSALRAVLYGVGTTDLATYAAGCAVLVAATLAASWIPAWRAGRVDPMVVMRAE
ncbi:MAG: ABC transporter permease [Gemmatimonadales bacterium]